MLIHLLHKQSSDQVLVFTRTKRRATRLAEQLITAGFPLRRYKAISPRTSGMQPMRAFRQGE